MNWTKEEIKGMRDRGEITPAEYTRLMQKFVPKKPEAPPVEPDPVQPFDKIAGCIEQAAKESANIAKDNSNQVEKALLQIVKSLNEKSKVTLHRLSELTVERNDRDLITRIIPHYEKV